MTTKDFLFMGEASCRGPRERHAPGPNLALNGPGAIWHDRSVRLLTYLLTCIRLHILFNTTLTYPRTVLIVLRLAAHTYDVMFPCFPVLRFPPPYFHSPAFFIPAFSASPKMHQIRFSLGLRPRPSWGNLAYSASPHPLAIFWGAYF